MADGSCKLCELWGHAESLMFSPRNVVNAIQLFGGATISNARYIFVFTHPSVSGIHILTSRTIDSLTRAEILG